METFKAVIGTLFFAIFINVLGYQYFFGDMETDSSIIIPIELPEIQSLFEIPYVHKDSPEVICMAENIFHEARDQSVDGMEAVGFVTLNRANHLSFPDNVCDVVFDPMQFSWTAVNPIINLNNSIERDAWELSLAVAYSVLNNELENPFLGVNHYHTTEVNPHWSRNMPKFAQIDDHIFFKSGM